MGASSDIYPRERSGGEASGAAPASPLGAPCWEPRVLVVDDDPVCRAAAASLLAQLGLQVNLAEDGRDALRMAAEWPYVAIFMDCFMPGLDGYQAASRIRARAGCDQAPLVVAVTAHSRHVSLASGMDHHISKPLRLEQLRDDCDRLGLLAPPDREPGGLQVRWPLLEIRPGLPPARAAELLLGFVTRARRHLPRLWCAANRRELGSIAELATELGGRAAGVGAVRVAGICQSMLDAVRRGRGAAAAALEPELRTALVETEQAARAFAGAAVLPAAVSGPTLPTTIRVAIADDDALARLAIETMIRGGERLQLVGSAGDVDGIAELVAGRRPDVAVIDFFMPGGGGAEAARRVRERCPGTRVIALTASDSPQAYLAMLDAGADGLLVKGGSPRRLVELIHRAAARSRA